MALPPQFFRRSYLFLLTVLVAVYTAVVIVYPTPWVDLPLGLLTLLFVPGYAIGALAFGARPRWPWSLTFAVVVGLSVAFNVALGLILLALNVGLPAPTFAFVSLILVMVALLVWVATRPTETGSRFTNYLREELRLPGHSPSQRALGYALLLGIVLTLAMIVYIASIYPVPPSDLSLGLTGPGGISANLPQNGTINSTLALYIIVGNNATTQQLTLKVLSFIGAVAPNNYTSVNWTQPLLLGNGTVSSVPVNLTPSESLTVHFKFFFLSAGSYILTFVLADPSGHTLRSASWSIAIA
ncbi:MAG: DUF1616 domain-containing protein [Thermoplasmata archaeon]|nr:DUF1616 domain-containing protein [Thermoplasmata archaeon]